MLERIIGPLPAWARRDHPLLRYELRGSPKPRRRLLRILAVILAALMLIAFGYAVATEFFSRELSPNLTETANRIAYPPLLLLQIALGIAALSTTIGAVGEIDRKQQWDNLRVTPSGAGLALRTRWASVFYRLRPLLAIILIGRALLILGILWDLTAFQGQYLDLLISGIVPQMSIVVPIGEPPLDLGVAVGVMLLAFMLTAAILLPFTGVGFDAAFGLLLSTLVKNRTYNSMLQFALILFRLALTGALVFAAFQFIAGDLRLAEGPAWALMLGFGALADWGLYFLHLSSFGEIWAIVPYGVLLGLALVIFALVQAFIADRLLLLAIHFAQRRG